MCTTFWQAMMLAKFCIQKFVEMWETFCIQIFCIHFIYKSLWKCGIHFVYKHFVYILFKKCIQKFDEIWDIFCIQTFYLYTFCIHQFWSTKSVHHKHFVYNLYTKFIQNVCTNNCMQNGSIPYFNIFDLFVVQFIVNHCGQLRLETCWLITGGTYHIDGLLDYTLH